MIPGQPPLLPVPDDLLTLLLSQDPWHNPGLARNNLSQAIIREGVKSYGGRKLHTGQVLPLQLLLLLLSERGGKLDSRPGLPLVLRWGVVWPGGE